MRRLMGFVVVGLIGLGLIHMLYPFIRRITRRFDGLNDYLDKINFWGVYLPAFLTGVLVGGIIYGC